MFGTVKKNLNRLINRLARRFKWFNRLISAPINRQLLTVNRLNHVVKIKLGIGRSKRFKRLTGAEINQLIDKIND